VERTAKAVETSLRLQADADVVRAAIDTPQTLVEVLKSTRADVAFNLCESLRGDPRYEIPVPVILESQGIPYTGNAPLALRVALDKSTARATLQDRGVPVPDGHLVAGEGDVMRLEGPLPAIVKPAREDGSIGIEASSVVHDARALRRRARFVLNTLKQSAIVERFVDGREFNVSVLGDDQPACLPLAEIDFSGMPKDVPRIVSYRAKWHNRTAEYKGTIPTFGGTDEALSRRIRRAALGAFRALGLRDYARIDLRVDAEGRPFVIDVNPNCDLAPDAGFPKAAKAAGIEYPDLVHQLLGFALQRGKRHATASDPNRRSSLFA
jgi:D-alanine-D-alanine ligase